VAERDGADAERARLGKRTRERLLEGNSPSPLGEGRGWQRLELKQRLSERIGLGVDELLAHAVKADAAGIAFGGLDDVGALQAASTCRPVMRPRSSQPTRPTARKPAHVHSVSHS